MYAGTTIEICALEKFVHLAGVVHPPMVLVSIEVPDREALIIQLPLAALPQDWADLPASASTQEFGRQWLQSASHLLLLLPSAIIPESRNGVINPAHPAYPDVRLDIVRDFTFDARMFKDA